MIQKDIERIKKHFPIIDQKNESQEHSLHDVNNLPQSDETSINISGDSKVPEAQENAVGGQWQFSFNAVPLQKICAQE